MTPEERALLLKLAECFNDLAALPDKHPSDMCEATAHIHALQNIVMARVARRQHPELFN